MKKLPGFVIREFTDPKLRDSLMELEPICGALHDAALRIKTLLTSQSAEEPSNLVLLGHGILEETKDITSRVDSGEIDSLADYFDAIGHVFSDTAALIETNHSNIKNPALKKHLLNVANTMFLETRIMDILNAYFDIVYPPDDSPRAG